MKHVDRNSAPQYPSEWDSLVVRSFLERNSVNLPGKDKDAKLKKLGEDLKAIKELEDWSPKTMWSVEPKSSYQRVAELRGLTGDVTCLRVLPGGEVIASDCDGRLVSWLEIAAGKWKKTEIDCNCSSHLEILPDRRLVAGSALRGITVYGRSEDLNWHQQASIDLEFDVTGIQATPDGRIISVDENNNILAFTEASAGKWEIEGIAQFTQDVKVSRVTPDGMLVVLYGEASFCKLFRDSKGHWQHFGMPKRDESQFGTVEVVSNDLIISGSRDFKIRIIRRSPDSGEWLGSRIKAHRGPVTCLSAFSDETIVSGGADHDVIVSNKWESGGKILREWLQGHTGVITCVQLLPDGRVVSGSEDGTLRVWSRQPDGGWHSEVLDTMTWSEGFLKRLGALPRENASATVTHLQVLPDGRIISAGAGGRVQVWDGQPISPKEA